MLSWFVFMVMLPPFPGLVEPINTVALILAFSPISMLLASMVIAPGSPALAVSVIRLVFLSRIRLLASISIRPAFPMLSVLAISLLLLVS